MSPTSLPMPVEETADASALSAAEIVEQLLKAAHLLRWVLTAHFAEFGLSDIRFATLQIVSRAAPEGCSQTELAEQLKQSESSVSALVERMRNDGLLYRLRSKSDRRKRVLMLTHEGRQLLQRVESCHAERMSGLLACINAPQQQALRQTLSLLVDELTQRRADDRHSGTRTPVPNWTEEQRRSA